LYLICVIRRRYLSQLGSFVAAGSVRSWFGSGQNGKNGVAFFFFFFFNGAPPRTDASS